MTPAAAQEERRRQMVGLRQRGLTYREIAEQVGLSRTGVIDICQRFASEGADSDEVGRPFRMNPATCSGRNQPGISSDASRGRNGGLRAG